MEKIYSVILEDNRTGDSVTISVNGCGLPMAKHHAEVYCRQNGIRNIVKNPKNQKHFVGIAYSVPVGKNQVVWQCDMPHYIDGFTGELHTRILG